MRRHGAHAIGIGRKRVQGSKTGRLALIFYVERKRPPGQLGAEPIPGTISFTPEGSSEPLEVPTDVVEAPQARSE
jgi:hypothetical protein